MVSFSATLTTSVKDAGVADSSVDTSSRTKSLSTTNLVSLASGTSFVKHLYRKSHNKVASLKHHFLTTGIIAIAALAAITEGTAAGIVATTATATL
jgi:hypothetical protein